MMLRLPNLDAMPEASPANHVQLKMARERLDRVKKSATKPPNDDALKQIRNLVKERQSMYIAKLLEKKVYKRALFSLWELEHKLFDNWRVPDNIIDRAVDGLSSDLLFQQIFTAYLTHPTDAQLVKAVNLAFKNIMCFPKKAVKYAALANDITLISLAGPKVFSARCIQNGRSLKFEASILGVVQYIDKPYFSIAASHLYLTKLRDKEVELTESFCKEVSDPKIASAFYSENRLLGHEIISVLITRYENTTPPQCVLDLILKVASDPRTSRHSESFQRWWAVLGDEAVALFKKWLSGVDIKLFLNIFEEFVKQSGDVDMQRMFPARKSFMEGLLRSDLVTESKIFLNHRAQRYLKQNMAGDEIPYHGLYKDTNTSVIYLKLGHLHFLEGSHSFKLRISPMLPADLQLNSHTFHTLVPHDCRHRFLRGAPATTVFESSHTSNLGWISNTVKYLNENGIRIQASDVVRAEDYQHYRRRHGV